MGGDGIQMSRFFVDSSAVDVQANSICITGDDVNHIRNVLREGPGASLVLCDGRGNDYQVRIEQMEKDRIITSIIETTSCKTEPPVEIILFQGVPKSDKMELIIQKTVELGISRIIPVITDRTVVKFDGAKDKAAKTARWNKIALEAAKQCNRGIIPHVDEPVTFGAAVALIRENQNPIDMALIPYEKESAITLGSAVDSAASVMGIKRAAVFIGPEGGFSEKEIQTAKDKGITPVTLGPRILRTETAGLAVLAILMHMIGDMG
jgi:16S rRNA (uracil1498-N3)-methyltransferase